MSIELSIIVPAYKAESFIKSAIAEKLLVLESMGIMYELIVVLDGESFATVKQLEEIANPNLKVLHYIENQGKGFAVKFGCMQATGKYIGYTDADNDIDPKIIVEMYNEIKAKKVDMVIPSKFHKDSHIYQPFKRKIISRLFSLYTRLVLWLPFSDTQLGAKLYKREVIKQVMPKILVKRFAFESEMLTVAYHYGFNKFSEVPTSLNLNTKSTVNLSDGFKSAWDTLAIFYRLRILKYYDQDRKIFLNKARFEFSKMRML
jgi:glycosyltransferase involved in cell wall biosynthesis